MTTFQAWDLLRQVWTNNYDDNIQAEQGSVGFIWPITREGARERSFFCHQQSKVGV